MRAQFIREERFVRGKNPKHALNIGIANKVFQSCGKNYIDGGGYSFDYYGPDNWMDIIRWLIEQGYNAEETEQVMRSKLMRWASDRAGHVDGDCTLEDFLKFNHDLWKGKTQVDIFLDEYFPDPERKNRLKNIVQEDAMGGVSAPISTLGNTPGMGNAQPAAKASTGALNGAPTGSGDKWDASIGPVNTQAGAKKITEENINPHDKIGTMMAKKMKVPMTFKKGKGDKDVEQVKVDEDMDLSTKLITFDEWAKKFSK
jgi:hypothetical protein